MKYSILFLLIMFSSCQEKKSTKVKNEKKSDSLVEIVEKENDKADISKIIKNDTKIDPISIFPKDTIITSKYLFYFKQISKDDYNKLSKSIINTEFKQDNPSSFLTKKDSCYYISLMNSKKDTLCDFDDGEYHEKYTYGGFNKELNTLIFDWENWEEAHSILINLKQYKHWILCPNYKLSPKNKIVTFSNYIDNPIYEKNEFIIYETGKDSIIELYYNSNRNYGVFNSYWINQSNLIIHLKSIDPDKFISKEPYFFEITIEDKK